MGLKEMATVSSSIAASDDKVRMYLRFSILECDVADQGQQLHLFLEDAGWLIFL